MSLEIRVTDDVVIARHLENLDRRLGNVEQILPTLATKEDLRALATKDEIRTLATKHELRTEIDRLQRHIDVVDESLHSDIQLLAEHLMSVMPKGTGASS
jgi:uncharacterized protein YicC (UPF0701 family)